MVQRALSVEDCKAIAYGQFDNQSKRLIDIFYERFNEEDLPKSAISTRKKKRDPLITWGNRGPDIKWSKKKKDEFFSEKEFKI